MDSQNLMKDLNDTSSNKNTLFKTPFKLNFKAKKKEFVAVNTSSNFSNENDTNFEENEEKGIKRNIVCLENGIIKE